MPASWQVPEPVALSLATALLQADPTAALLPQ
jgi:hypothetical protein